MLHSTVSTLLQRIPAIRTRDTIQNARALSDNAFIMHYRLSRDMTYELIDKFENSTVYAAIQRV